MCEWKIGEGLELPRFHGLQLKLASMVIRSIANTILYLHLKVRAFLFGVFRIIDHRLLHFNKILFFRHCLVLERCNWGRICMQVAGNMTWNWSIA